jgi:D-tyrosyl-tRNA(Tyr) deacylase
MRVVIQRVARAAVRVGTRVTASIGPGLLVLVGVATGDTPADAAYLASKTLNLRIFEDDAGKLNRSLLETGGQLLCVSQFTLLGDCRKGRRPSFTDAAGGEVGRALFDRFCAECASLGVSPGTGEFGAHMMVELVNDGPVTLIIDSEGGGPARTEVGQA